MLDKIKKTISIYNMLSESDSVLIGLSGGPDSVCLIYILKELVPRYNLKLFIAHLNHGFRGKESDKDQIFCEGLGRRMGIPVFAKKVRIEKTEDSARKARYEFLSEIAHKVGAKKIALGHNADDQVETVLMRLLRGAGTRGLSGIPPVRRQGDIFIIRPLINVWREEILNYLKRRNIPYRIDRTNIKLDYFRNRIRHELIPFLTRYNPNIKNILMNTGRNMALMNRYLEQELVRKTAQGFGLNLSAGHISDIMALASGREGSKSLCLPKDMIVTREYGNLFFSKGKYKNRGFKFILPIPGEVRITGYNIFIASKLCKKPRKIIRKPFEVMLDYDKIFSPLIIRNRRPGDVFQPIGLKGRKKLSDIFIDEKIPKRVRGEIPLIVSGREICWIPGYRVGERFKIGPETKRVVRIKVTGGYG